MTRAAVALALLIASASGQANEKFDTTTKNEKASALLSALAREAGLTLQNPQLAKGRLDAAYQHGEARTMLEVLAWNRGLELHVRGTRAWLLPVRELSNASGGGDAG